MDKPKPWRTIFGTALAGSVFILVWTFSVFLAANSNLAQFQKVDLAAILFGAASIALFLFSILIAVAAILGWQSIQKAVRETSRSVASKVAASKVEPLQDELRGRALSILGYILGEMSVEPGSMKPKDGERLAEAVSLCQQGYDYLCRVGGPAEFMALNNLIYYSSLQGDVSRLDFLLSSARTLSEMGQKKGSVNLQLTGGKVLLQHGAYEEKVKIRQVLQSLSARDDLSERQRKEAKLFLASFPVAETKDTVGPTKQA